VVLLQKAQKCGCDFRFRQFWSVSVEPVAATRETLAGKHCPGIIDTSRGCVVQLFPAKKLPHSRHEHYTVYSSVNFCTVAYLQQRPSNFCLSVTFPKFWSAINFEEIVLSSVWGPSKCVSIKRVHSTFSLRLGSIPLKPLRILGKRY